MKKLNVIVVLPLFLLLLPSLKAAETDQFYASSAVIRDSSAEMNDFFHQRIDLALNEVNQKKRTPSCKMVAKEVLHQIVGEVKIIEWIKDKSFSKVSVFTQESPLIERFPDESVDDKNYRAHSIYQNRPFPVNVVGVARTLNINGIYIGTDKIGHFSIVGKTYYKHFLEALEKGMSLKDAESFAVNKGLKEEIAILGYAIGGTFSYGDLEANYQGLQFARHMCEGENPYLIQVNKKWVENPEHLFDIRAYVNPKLDEAYNVSFWSPRMWKKMKNEITSSYCANKANASYQARAAHYDQIVKESHNDELIAKFLKQKPKFDRKNQLLSKNILCD